MIMSLSTNAVATLQRMKESKEDPSFNPIVQVLNVKKVATKPQRGGTDRYRVVLSDGEHFVQGILMAQLNHLVMQGEIKTNSVIKLNDFMINILNNKTVVIVLAVDVIQSEYPGGRIGDPTERNQADNSNSNQNQNQPLYNKTNQQSYNNDSNNNYGNNNKMNNSYSSGGGYNNNNNNAQPQNVSSSSYGGNNPYGGSSNRYNNNYNSPSAPIVRSSGPGGMSPDGVRYTAISSLNMYQNRWTIKARVTNKSDIRTWSNAKGEGSLFSIELLDSSSMDIKATLFKEAVDKFYNLIEEGKIYTFSGGRLKIANAQYNTCKSNFEITFDQNSEIRLIDDVGDIKRQSYDFVKICDIETKEANSVIDVLAVVKQVGEPTTLTSKKTGKELLKCNLTLIDDSNVEISLTVWGDKATRAPMEYTVGNDGMPPVVAFRRCRVSDYGGKTLSLSGSSEANPEGVPEVMPLKNWWSNGGGSSGSAKTLSSMTGGAGGQAAGLADRRDICVIKDEHLGHNPDGKPDWISFKGTISFLKKDKEGGAWYPACSNSGEPCKNLYKVTQTTDGQWFCDKCGQTSPTCMRKWIFSGTVEDDTSSTWVSFFNDQAEMLLADNIHSENKEESTVKASDIFERYMDPESPDGLNTDAYDGLFLKSTFTEWIFKCRVKSEMVNDEQRVKASVYNLHPVDYAKECRDLLAAIESF